MCDNVVSTVRSSLLKLVKFSFLFFSYLLLFFITPVNKDYQNAEYRMRSNVMTLNGINGSGNCSRELN